jgi:hypothetical protein
VDRSAETFAPEENVSETRILDFGNPSLLVEVESNIAHVCLDMAQMEGDLVVTIVVDGTVWRELDEVMRLDGDKANS